MLVGLDPSVQIGMDNQFDKKRVCHAIVMEIKHSLV